MEIHNTPWGEEYLRACDARTGQRDAEWHRYRLDKEFHVSPFMPMDIVYDWRFTVQAEQLASMRRTLFSSDTIGDINPSTEWAVEHLDWADPANQQIKRKRIPSAGWKFLRGSGIHRGRLVGGCIEVFDWTRGTEIFPGDWQDAILFLETSEDAPPPEFVDRTLRVYAAMGILSRLSGIVFGRPGGQIPPDRFEEYGKAILQW